MRDILGRPLKRSTENPDELVARVDRFKTEILNVCLRHGMTFDAVDVNYGIRIYPNIPPGEDNPLDHADIWEYL